MAITDRGHPVEVDVGACRCPGTPHARDLVWLKPELDVPLAIAANAAIRGIDVVGLSVGEANVEVQYALTGIYLRHSILRWTFLDEQGEGVPIGPSNITHLLPWGNGGGEVAEAADALYSEALFAPLVAAVAAAEKKLNRQARRQMKKSSVNGRTGSSTSATLVYGVTPQAPSAPSSPTSSGGQPSTP